MSKRRFRQKQILELAQRFLMISPRKIYYHILAFKVEIQSHFRIYDALSFDIYKQMLSFTA